MNLTQALEQDFEVYMAWCRDYVAAKASGDAITAQLLGYPYAMTGLEASWARRYWYHKNDANTNVASAQVQDAIKLAFIKLQQTGGFQSVDGVQTLDLMAYKQILDAIHSFDPEFKFGELPANTKPNPYIEAPRRDNPGEIERATWATLAEARAYASGVEVLTDTVLDQGGDSIRTSEPAQGPDGRFTVIVSGAIDDEEDPDDDE